MKTLVASIRCILFFTVLTGVLYPLAMTGVAALIFPQSAQAHLIQRNGALVGSALIAQEFIDPKYFWERPSATGYNPLPSGGTNFGGTSEKLKQAVDERRAALKQAHATTEEPPQDLLFASASGLDPHISPEAARYQIDRVAKARNIPLKYIELLVSNHTEGRQFGIFGEPRVNVLLLNLELDQIASVRRNE
jgi:K+-transporting ATPase ATPase C chain